MRIGIIGGGAIGLLFAHYLSVNHTITVYTRTTEQAELLNQKGLTFLIDDVKQTQEILAKRLSNDVDDEELLIVTVKQYHLSGIYKFIKDFLKPMLFIQNGYGHIEFMESLRSSSIYVGVVEHGALRHRPDIVEHTGIGKTKLAIFRGEGNDMPFVKDSITSFPFEMYEDYHSMLLEKLIVNAVINPLTAILRVPNGELIKNTRYTQLMEEYFNELTSILHIQNKNEALEHVKQVCLLTSENRSSMLKDIENGRQTEVDAILGYILHQAKQTKQEHCLTHFLYTIIKGKENQKG